MDWREDAACRGLTHLFYRDDGDRAGYSRAKALCAACPVRAECAAEGAGEVYGVWGGQSPRERRVKGGVGRRDPQQVPPAHGTPAGYRQHRRLGERACDECRAAHSNYNRRAKYRRRDAA